MGDAGRTAGRVAYKAEWSHGKHGLRRTIDIASPADLQISTPSTDNIETGTGSIVLEVIINIKAELRAKQLLDNNSDIFEEQSDEKAAPSLKPEDLHIRKIGETRVVLKSARLTDAVRRAIKYYPSQDLTSENIEVYEPYQCLIHYFDVFDGWTKPCQHTGIGEGCDIHPDRSLCAAETRDHIQVMLDFLEPSMVNKVRPAYEKLKKATPVIAFDMLWLLFRPGTEVYRSWPEQYSSLTGPITMCSIAYKAVEDPLRLDPTMDDQIIDLELEDSRLLRVDTWLVCSDGEKFGRCRSAIYIKHYAGEQEVTQLEVYPSQYCKNLDLKSDLIRRGKRAAELFASRSEAVSFDGISYVASDRPQAVSSEDTTPMSTAQSNIC
jgi:hypothetical protein